MTRLCFSNETTDLFKALHKAQQVIQNVKRDAQNPHFKSRYATLDSVIAACKEPLNDNGLVLTQAPVFDDDKLEVITQITHAESGQFMRSALGMPLTKVDAQGVGSALTYGCRYSLMALLGIAPTDDDGEAAVNRNSANLKKSAYKARGDGDWEKMQAEIDGCVTPDELLQWAAARKPDIDMLPDNWRDHLREKYEAKMEELKLRFAEAAE